jgi:hypothetical protein
LYLSFVTHSAEISREFTSNISHIKLFLRARGFGVAYCDPNVISSCITGTKMIQFLWFFEAYFHRYFLSRLLCLLEGSNEERLLFGLGRHVFGSPAWGRCLG